MPLYQMLLVLLASSGLLMAGLEWLWGRKRMEKMRLSALPSRPVSKGALVRSAAQNSVVSMGFIMTMGVLEPSWLFERGAFSPMRLVIESVLVLLVYDVLYYLLHRYPLHKTGYLKRVHAVHHTVRSPTALDSLYLHPIETFLGVLVLFVSTFVVGPVHVYSFALIFFVFSHANILIHCGLALPFAPLRAMVQKHATHHVSMRGGNYASLTPIPDYLFGTAE